MNNVMSIDKVLGKIDLNKGNNKEIINSVLSTLTPREEKVIRLVYGIDCEKKTIDEIATEFGVTNARIVQIHAKAIRRLNHPSRYDVIKTLV